jgi:hypothetical protein
VPSTTTTTTATAIIITTSTLTLHRANTEELRWETSQRSTTLLKGSRNSPSAKKKTYNKEIRAANTSFDRFLQVRKFPDGYVGARWVAGAIWRRRNASNINQCPCINTVESDPPAWTRDRSLFFFFSFFSMSMSIIGMMMRRIHPSLSYIPWGREKMAMTGSFAYDFF